MSNENKNESAESNSNEEINSKTNLEKVIDDSSKMNDNSLKEENYFQRENELKNIRQNYIDERREMKVKSLKGIKKLVLKYLKYTDSIFKCGINIKYNCSKFYNCVQNGLNIPIVSSNIYLVEGDGNYFYRCLSVFLYGRIDYFDVLRKAVITFCKKNKEEIIEFRKEVEIRNGVFIETKEYIDSMEKNINWSSDIEITICSYLFCVNIAIYSYCNDGMNYEYVNSYLYDENNLNYPLMIMSNEKLDHFHLIYPKVEMEENNIIAKYLDLNNNDEEVTKIINDINPFPKYTKGTDENLYYNIFKFLYNGIKNGKRTWPDYIENTKDRKQREIQKTNFYRRAGIIKSTVTKRDSDELLYIKDKYLIENNRLYITLYEFNNGNENDLIYRKYMIPFDKEVNSIINICHNQCNHKGLDETLETIKKNNFFWCNMHKDIKKFLKRCLICTK